MSGYTPTTAHVREVFSNRPGCDYVKQRLEFNRWLWAHNATLVTEFLQQPEFQEMLAARDAATRTAALEEAATLLEFPIGIQVTNGVGWVPTDSRAGAARYLRHLARNGDTA